MRANDIFYRNSGQIKLFYQGRRIETFKFTSEKNRKEIIDVYVGVIKKLGLAGAYMDVSHSYVSENKINRPPAEYSNKNYNHIFL